jgi:hypothetical protein
MKAKSRVREEKLAAALRENLKRRKDKARALSRPAASDAAEAPAQRQNVAKKDD